MKCYDVIIRGLAVIVLGCAFCTLHANAEPPAANESKVIAPAVFGWRGDGTGSFPAATPPTQWDAEKKQGILWSAKVGKSLYNSPIVAGDKVLVLAEPDSLICLDAQTGKQLWSKATTINDLPEPVELVPGHDEVGNTTPTPVTDGHNVFIVFANGIVTSFDLQGNRRWITFISEGSATGYGRSASPCLVDGKLIVSMGYVTALDPATGKILWKAEKVTEAYGSPVAAKVDDISLIVSPSGHILRASDGVILTKPSGELTYNSPVVAEGKAFFIDADAIAASLTKEAGPVKKLWTADLDGEYFASPVYHDGLIYAASNQGQLSVIDAKEGKAVYTKDLGIANMKGDPGVPPGNVYPSLCVAGNHIYISNDQGETLVIEAGREYKELAHNTVPDNIAGTPVFAGNRLYIRTRDILYCIGKENP